MEQQGGEEDVNMRYCFEVTWFDQQAQLAREYQLLFYPADSSLEMVGDGGVPFPSCG